MKLKCKSLCGLKKSAFKENFHKIEKMVSNPKFICGKCARVANSDAFLCKPKRLGI